MNSIEFIETLEGCIGIAVELDDYICYKYETNIVIKSHTPDKYYRLIKTEDGCRVEGLFAANGNLGVVYNYESHRTIIIYDVPSPDSEPVKIYISNPIVSRRHQCVPYLKGGFIFEDLPYHGRNNTNTKLVLG